MSSAIKKICIIGAGPNGLMSARHLSECHNTEVTIFEANSEVGGLWVYDEKNEADKKFEPEKQNDNYYKLNHYFHASLYPYLQSNLPYFFMGFKDLSHSDIVKDISVFINISQHKAYLEAYAEKFDLKRKTVFNTLVKSVRLYENLTPEMQEQVPEKRKFAVTTASSRGGDLEKDEKVHAFDYVVVCTGHNSKPHVPEVKGIKKFKGKVMTAKSFREPTADHFIDKRILVLGASYSAIDMVVQLFDNPYVGPQNLKEMTLVGRGVQAMKTSNDFDKYRRSGKLNVVEGEINEVIGDNTIRLSDGSEHEIDTLVFCTGYELNFPFLDFETDKMIDFNRNAFSGKFIAPIYKRFVSIREPNLLFIGFLDYSAIGSFCDEAQALLAKAIVDGKYKLPSQNEMIQSFLKDINDMQWSYGKSMACFFKMFPLKLDIAYLEDLKGLLKEIYPHDIDKAKEFNDALIASYKKILEFFSSGNVLSYKKFDFHTIFERRIRNSTSFI